MSHIKGLRGVKSQGFPDLRTVILHSPLPDTVKGRLLQFFFHLREVDVKYSIFLGPRDLLEYLPVDCPCGCNLTLYPFFI